MPRIKAPSNKNVTIRTKWGAAISLKAGEEREVIPALLRPAMDAGCFLVEGTPPPVKDANSRKAEIKAAVEKLIEAGDTAAFTSSGQPRVAFVANIVGYDVKADEIAAVMAEISDDGS